MSHLVRWLRGGALGTPLLLGLLAAAHAAAPDAMFLAPDPGLSIPRMKFTTGRAVDNKPELFPMTPAIPGPVSGWTVTQWDQSHPLRPDAMATNAPGTRDPGLGRAAYAFGTPADATHLWIYRRPGRAGGYVYELYQRDGILRQGGKNLFLAAKATRPDFTMDHPLDYAVKVRLSRVALRYDTPAAARNGAVQGTVFSSFVFGLRPGTGLRHATIFLQIPISGSHGGRSDYLSCRVAGRGVVVTANQDVPGQVILPFESDSGPPTALHQRVNQYLCALLTRLHRCQDGASLVPLPDQAAFDDLGNWRLESMYVGLETQATDMRPNSVSRRPQGTVAVALQVSDLRLRGLPSGEVARRNCGGG